MPGPAQSPLQRYLAVQKPLDAQMRVLLREAAEEAERIVAAYGSKETFGKTRMHKAAASLRKVSLETWGEVDGITQDGIKKAASAAALSERWMQGVLKDRLGAELSDWDKALGYSAENGITALLAKQKNAIPLSRRIYKAKAWTDAALEKTLQKGILLQKSAVEIAKDVRGFINPNVPGGVSSAAFRLGRTEINNAFHTQQIDSRSDEPWTEAFRWNLSGSHRVPDECNRYADQEHFGGRGKGVFKKGSVPAKPHPNCLCYLTTVTVSEDEFVEGFLGGKYDEFMDSRLGELPSARPSAGAALDHRIKEAGSVTPEWWAGIDLDKTYAGQKSGYKDRYETWKRTLDPYEEYPSINFYAAAGTHMNSYLRGGSPNIKQIYIDEALKLAKIAEEKGDKLAKDLVLNRMIMRNPGFEPTEVFKEGSFFLEKGFMSTTVDPKMVGFRSGFELHIKAPKGTKVIYGLDLQGEVVLPPNTTLKILKHEQRGDEMHIYAEVVDG